jgi:uncharacterized protein
MHYPFLIDEPRGLVVATLVLGHGAGAPMDSDFMNRLSASLAAQGLRVLRYEFSYMALRRSGTRRPPDAMPVLQSRLMGLLAGIEGPLFIGGKSMGGRVASMVADQAGVSGVICYGYPFHPPGKPERTRTEHLMHLQTPALILQGTRDPFGKPEEVGSYPLSHRIRIAWLESGDHDFKPLRRSGQTQAGLIDQAAEATARFVETCLR